jgi:hypothetical protein
MHDRIQVGPVLQVVQQNIGGVVRHPACLQRFWTQGRRHSQECSTSLGGKSGEIGPSNLLVLQISPGA